MSAQVFAPGESGASFSGIAVGCRSAPTDMESPGAASRNPDDPPRVKFLCSFGGSVLPRPLDGHLRYVGGDTRIIAVPRDVSYEDLLGRMREIFEGVSIIKYQQPDEDIDALVSVVNDDDVINMMEEFDKLVGVPGDGFTRLRIFLFAQQSENDLIAISPPLGDRDADRRYVDALNSLPPSPDTLEQCLSPLGIDVGIQGQVNLHHIKVPNPYHMQRYGEADYPLSPAYYSPGHHAGALNPREFTPSPSAARFPFAAGEFGDRVQDELAKQAAVHQLHSYEHQSPSRQLENFVWLPPGAIVHEKAGFPTNLGHSRAVMNGNSNCEHCRMAFDRNSDVLPDAYYLDHGWKHGQTKLEHLNTLNDVGHFPNSCGECHRNQDLKLDHGGYARAQNEQHHSIFSEVYGCDRTSLMHSNQVGHRIDDTSLRSGAGRVNEHHVLDCNVMDIPLLHRNIYDAHSSPSGCTVHDVKSYPSNDTGMVNDVFLPPGPYTNIQGFQDSEMRYGNSAYGAESLYQVPHNLPPIQALQMKLQAPAYSGTSYKSSGFMMPNGVSVPGLEKHTQEGSPRSPYFQVEDQIPNGILGKNNNLLLKFQEHDNSMALQFFYQHATQLNPNAHNQDNLLPVACDSASCCPSKLHTEAPQIQLVTSVPECPTDKSLLVPSPSGLHHLPVIGHGIAVEMETLLDKNLNEGHIEIDNKPGGDINEKEQVMEVNLGILNLNEGPSSKVFHADDSNASHRNGNIPEESLKFLPELIASVKKAILKGAEEVMTEAQKDSEEGVLPAPTQENPNAAMEAESLTNGDDEQNKHSTIEPTTAEAEALTKGLQTINNDDLEEIRELGAGTFGSVYYGKWRGSDVAIKRIKASCFAGKPSERERLIADFWKEALIMSSLHHPNVVSFYGVVRDGSDGSLATITEFMINGSLKQFLQKKDRTIDRRKRLIIAMDAACGMEYLHSKNIVHFDLKCENLLVNMRDPHRPICKIGDLGLSKVKKHTLVSGGIRGTLPWMAPELLSGKSNKVSEKIDVYSFGIVMWELLTGEDPYADMRSASMIGGIINNTLRPKVPTWCDPEWKSLMESCWSSDPVLRPSFSDISQNLRKMAAAMNLK